MLISEEFSKYEIKERLYTSPQFSLCTSQENENADSYILHIFRSNSEDRSMYEKAHAVHNMLSRIEEPRNITNLVRVEEMSDYVVLVGENDGGITLRQLMATSKLPITNYQLPIGVFH